MLPLLLCLHPPRYLPLSLGMEEISCSSHSKSLQEERNCSLQNGKAYSAPAYASPAGAQWLKSCGSTVGGQIQSFGMERALGGGRRGCCRAGCWGSAGLRPGWVARGCSEKGQAGSCSPEGLREQEAMRGCRGCGVSSLQCCGFYAWEHLCEPLSSLLASYAPPKYQGSAAFPKAC